ncbi:MAG: fibronectin type III domain-containing protein [Flavobacteriales bacterium]
MKANIKLSLFELTFVKLLALLRNVVAKMTGNANFTNPAVPLSDMTKLADDLEAAIEDATNGSRQSKLVRNALVQQGRTMLRVQADYVRSVCAGDVVKLESSGFELAKQREPVGIPGTAKDMQALFTNRRGDVELRWRSVYGAHGYQVWMTDKDPAIEANWQAIGYTTRVRHTVSDLESLKAYWFCVSAIGTAGEGAQSDPAKGIAA